MSELKPCREAFEKWMVSKHANGLGEELIERLDGGRYRSPVTRFEWEAWQAAWNHRPAQAEAIKALEEAKAFCELICGSPNTTTIKGEIESTALYLAHGILVTLAALKEGR